MKILHLDSGREMRGGQWQVLRLHQSLVEAGHDSFLFARDGGPLLTMTRQRGLPCEVLRTLPVLTKSRSFDLVHAHDAFSHTTAVLFSRQPVVVSRRVAFPIGTSAASRLKYARADRYLAVSRYVAGLLIEAGIDSGSIDVVYDGVEIPPVPANGDTILTPYTVDPTKGMAVAEEAAALAEVPLVRSKNLEQDLPHARAMLYLTQAEGLGSGILLAMAHGVTVIATRTGGIPELISDGVNGFLVQNEPQSVADALSRLSPQLNPEPCARMGACARELVQNRFTVSHMVNATLNSYRKVLDA
jgi:hypothetical protein